MIARLPLCAFALLAACATAPEAPQAPATTELFYVRLENGLSTEGVPEDKLLQWSGEHRGNLRRLGEQGLGLAAGPVQDPSGSLAGISIVRGASPSEVRAYYAGDPFVQRDHLRVVPQPLWPVIGDFGEPGEPGAFDELVLLWARPTGRATADGGWDWATWLAERPEWRAHLCFAGALGEQREGVLAVFAAEVDGERLAWDDLQAQLNERSDTPVGLESFAMPLWHPDGAFDVAPSN
ncbi:MAG: YciI family protein [Planctomycetota bacterium]|jgi:uncharacterized protein YciI